MLGSATSPERGTAGRLAAGKIYNPSFIITVYLGDINLDNKVNSDDAIYLLRHTLFGESYPVPAGADFTGDGNVTSDDAIYLLRHTLFSESYPLANR